jgi:HSP20 family molecular chaperone IbpA
MFLLLHSLLLGGEREDYLSDSWRQRRKRRYEWVNRLNRTDRTERSIDHMFRRVLGSFDEDAKARGRCSCQPEGVPILHTRDLGTGEKSEPLVDVFEDEESIVVVAELIGIDKSNVDLHATQNKLTISVDLAGSRYYRDVELPAKVDVSTSSSRLKNGVLEIRLKKLSQELVIK